MTPPDVMRCQTKITEGFGFMDRCKNRPVAIVTERVAGTDGTRGAMSLCATCLVQFARQMPEGYADTEPLP